MSTLRMIITIIFMTSILMLSCDNPTNNGEVKLEKYLNNVFYTQVEEALYIITPMTSCEGCRQLVFRNLLAADIQKKMIVVMVGEVQEALTLNYINRLKGKGVGILEDPSGKALDYDLLREDYPITHISFIDVTANESPTLSVLTPNMINGEINIRQEIFKNYIK